MTKVTVIGQGYVGLPVAVRAAEAGFDVVGYETHLQLGMVKPVRLVAAQPGGHRLEPLTRLTEPVAQLGPRSVIAAVSGGERRAGS